MGDREDLERLEVESIIKEGYESYKKRDIEAREREREANRSNSGCAPVILAFVGTAGLLGYLALWLTQSLF